MTWRHVAALLGALALPVVCGFSRVCSAESMERIIGLSMIVVAGIMGNANSGAPKDKAP
jgi:hypothetical protein